MTVSAHVPIGPATGLFYQHGWHSWSTTGWRPHAGPAKYPLVAAHRRQATDPAHLDDPMIGGSGVGAVETGDGNIHLMGALGVDAWVSVDTTGMQGSGTSDWYQQQGKETDVFANYARALAAVLGERKGNPGSVWCSWYGFYRQISEDKLGRVLDELGDIPFDVFQVDDGWQQANGDWQANSAFASGLPALARRIKDTGRRPGLWLAPFLADASSQLFKDYKQMLLRDEQGELVVAAENWGEPSYTLDVTRADAQRWLAELIHSAVAQGYSYLKLDFLYAAAMPGRYQQPQGREAAYRAASEIMRSAAGENTYLLACGAPVIASIGIYDGLRVGPDVAGQWDNVDRTLHLRDRAGPGAADAITTSLGRYWLAPLIDIDPDVAYFRTRYNLLTPGQQQYLVDLAHICDFRANADPPAWLSQTERAALRQFLSDRPRIKQLDRYKFQLDQRVVDFSAIAAARPW